MSSIINAATAGGLISSGDTSGILKLQTASTDAVTIDASQNMGIGTTSPTQKLNVSGAATTNPSILLSEVSGSSLQMISGASDSFIGTTGSTPLRLGTAFTERMRIDSSGNLGVGTSSPAAKLQISSGAGGDTTGLRITRTDSGGGDFRIWSTATANGEGAGKLLFSNAANLMTLDGSGNLGVGTTTPSTYGKLVSISSGTDTTVALVNTSSVSASNTVSTDYYLGDSNTGLSKVAIIGVINPSAGANRYGNIYFSTSSAGAPAERMRLDSSGNLLVGTTTSQGTKFAVDGGSSGAIWGRCSTAASAVHVVWNSATSGDNVFNQFYTDGAPNLRGTITYNRGAGLVAYNVTSDYRAKDIIGPVQNSGALIDSVPVYMGKMKGATQERPMFIAHETPEYAHTGEKDAVDADGNPVYQQMDASALIPVMWAEIQSLRTRLAALEGAAQ